MAGDYNVMAHHARPKVPQLPANKAQLHINSITINFHYKANIQIAAMYHPLNQQLANKHQWTKFMTNLILWPALLSIVKRFSVHNRVWTAKYVHRMLPTNAAGHQYNPRVSPDCILCGATNEIMLHALQCPHPKRCAWRKSALTKLCLRLEQVKTRQSMSNAIYTGVWCFLHSKPIHPTTCHNVVQDALQDQDLIGWEFFYLGFIS